MNEYYTPMYESMADAWNDAAKQAAIFIWEEFWPYIIGFFVLYMLACFLKVKLETLEEKRKRKREQEEFERRVEYYLKKKEEIEKTKRR